MPVIDVSRVFAAQLLERKRLYKFRAIDLTIPEHVAAIFEGQLYCPSPAELNDPWECRPRVVLEPLSQDERRAFVDSLRQVLELEWPDDLGTRLAEEVPEDLMRKPELFLDERYYDSARLQEYCDRVMARLSRNSAAWRICRFSATHEHPLLWAHYADSHRGICIEFDASDVRDIGCALPVKYVDALPMFHLLRGDALQSLSLLTTKSEPWKYEQEYRLVGREPYRSWEGAEIHQKIFRFAKDRITGVILGCRIDSQRRQLVGQWLRGLDHGVRVLQANPGDNEYELHFTEVASM